MSYAPLPTVAQVDVTRQLISSKKSEIATTEQQILEYEARIVDLRSKIVGIRHEIETHEAYIAPVRRLPFEVLGEIVTLRATDPDAPVQVLRDLASICRTWRDATLRTPKAWTKIDIQLPSDYQYLDGSETSRLRKRLESLRDVQEWFDRSGCCKKDVSLKYHGHKDELRSIIDLLVSRASELRSLQSPSIRDVELLSCAMPSLESLGVSTFEVDDKLMSTLVHSSPRLSFLRLSNGGHQVDGLLGLVQARLKSLIVDELTPGNLFRILRADGAFANLQVLKFAFSRYDRQPWNSNTSIASLPRLRALYISMDGVTIPLLEFLHLPQLESLALRTGYSPGRPSTKDAAALLRFPGDGVLQLRELRLEDLWISDADLLRLLKRTPRLELLAIVKGKTSDKVVSALASKQSRPSRWICPSLSRICIIADSSWKSDKFKVSKQGMGALITARLRANQAPLQGPPPPVARLMNVRVDDHDVVFNDILSLDWCWKPDEDPNAFGTYHVESDPILYGARWWHCPKMM